MACNENIIKNIASEVTRNCQSHNVSVEEDFVVYLIELLLLNPKYGKLFSKTIKRNNLEYFVNECVRTVTDGETSLNTLKMQFIMQTSYDKLQNLVNKHLVTINTCLCPLLNEILDTEPRSGEEEELKKLFRKVSIYIILASGLGNPSHITTLKEGVAALESVFGLEDLSMFTTLSRIEKVTQLKELVQIVSGVRLFNRDCKKGGEGIPDLPFSLLEAAKGCLSSLSSMLISAMQRVNGLTTAVADSISVQEDTGNVVLDIDSEVTEEHYKQIFELLIFSRQYEVFIRRLLSDVETLVQSGMQSVESVRKVLVDLHSAVKYKAAVPVVVVFPLFSKLWQIWRDMQNDMFLVSTVNRLMTILASIQDQIKVPHQLLEKLLAGKKVVSDQDRMGSTLKIEDRITLSSLKNYDSCDDSAFNIARKSVQYLGFCALCLTVGALVPRKMNIGLIKCKGSQYGFCSVKMAARFSKDPDRYINEVLHFARNHPHVINLLNITEDVYKVKDIDVLVTKHLAKIKVCDRVVQTETHPVESYIEKNYTSDLWEWKKRACQWATIVNCRTRSTQTNYSHLRSEIPCQTVQPRDKALQTKKDCGVATDSKLVYLWGLRGRLDDDQHAIKFERLSLSENKKAQTFTICNWPCVQPETSTASHSQVSNECVSTTESIHG